MNTSRAEPIVFETASTQETIRLAALLGTALAGGEAIALTGDLGAGKTHFVKGLAIGLEIEPDRVTSPTFLLIHQIDGRLPLAHMDAYRVGSGEELAEAGGGDFLDGRSVVVVEWAENVPDFLPGDRVEVRILVLGEERRSLEFLATGPVSARLLARWRSGLAEERS
jgi:tRNA threonylcarbamoyladenosine biosynthesis protein TsaE